ncbi:glycosyltransferase, partial [Escherichia coli]|nr:glycosyltransferase [Escherichia coli]
MDWLLDVFATWLYGLKVIAITLAVIMFISGLDDFFIDVVYWVRRIKRKLSVYRRYPRMSYRELYKPDEKPLAIMVPAWNETGVIGNMAELAATTLDYENYHIFVGTYPNDPDTQRDVDEVCARFPNVHKVVCARPGPTSCVFRSIRSRIGIEVRSAIRIHSINRELNFFYRFLTRFFAAFH